MTSRARIAFPYQVGKELRCNPNFETRIHVDAPPHCSDLEVDWQTTPTSRTIIRNLAEPLNRLGATDSQLVTLIVMGDRRVVLQPGNSGRTPRQDEPMEVGRMPPRVDSRSVSREPPARSQGARPKVPPVESRKASPKPRPSSTNGVPPKPPASKLPGFTTAHQMTPTDVALKAIERFWKSLDAHQQVVLQLRILAPKPVTLEEIGQQRHLSRERIRQIQRDVEHRLRRAFNETEGVTSWMSPVAATLRRQIGPVVAEDELGVLIEKHFSRRTVV